MVDKKWISKIARDIIALGSVIFYLLVAARALVGPFWHFFTFLCSAAVILIIIFLLNKDFELYISRGLILAIGTIYFYSDILFTIFASVVYCLMIISSSYLGNKGIKILKGLLVGSVSILGGYLTVEFFFEIPW